MSESRKQRRANVIKRVCVDADIDGKIAKLVGGREGQRTDERGWMKRGKKKRSTDVGIGLSFVGLPVAPLPETEVEPIRRPSRTVRDADEWQGNGENGKRFWLPSGRGF